MKRILSIAFVAMTMSACNLYVVEPRIDRRDRVAGYYSVDEYSQVYGDYSLYSIRISKSGQGHNVVNIDNFYGSGIRVRAYLDYDRITIPYQVVNGYEVEGSGTTHGSLLHFNYSVKDLYNGGPTDFCDSEALRE